MEKKHVNSFDRMVEAFITEFQKVENFALVTEDSETKSYVSGVINRIADLHSYKVLVTTQFIPAINKAIAVTRNDVKKSKYKQFIEDKDINFEETIQDTLRFSYVSLFHKLESYITEITRIVDSIMTFSEFQEPIEIWAKRELGFDFRHWRRFPVTHKVNYVSNCIKHKDGYPLKPDPPAEYINANKKERIRLTPSEFKADCDLLGKQYVLYFQIASLLRTYQYLLLQVAESEKSESQILPDNKVALTEKLDVMKTMITKCIDTNIWT